MTKTDPQHPTGRTDAPGTGTRNSDRGKEFQGGDHDQHLHGHAAGPMSHGPGADADPKAPMDRPKAPNGLKPKR